MGPPSKFALSIYTNNIPTNSRLNISVMPEWSDLVKIDVMPEWLKFTENCCGARVVEIE